MRYAIVNHPPNAFVVMIKLSCGIARDLPIQYGGCDRCILRAKHHISQNKYMGDHCFHGFLVDGQAMRFARDGKFCVIVHAT